ncbi:MAG: hypothetical protein IJS68_03530 [Clostridia bacterium]|nr:hypothetical protein [Clostridia bacterium]
MHEYKGDCPCCKKGDLSKRFLPDMAECDNCGRWIHVEGEFDSKECKTRPATLEEIVKASLKLYGYYLDDEFCEENRDIIEQTKFNVLNHGGFWDAVEAYKEEQNNNESTK